MKRDVQFQAFDFTKAGFYACLEPGCEVSRPEKKYLIHVPIWSPDIFHFFNQMY